VTGSTVSEHVPDYNDLNQRERVDLADGTYWLYSYNSKGEVTNGTHYNASNVAITGQNFGYAFDGIGNRTTTSIDTTTNATYTSNTQNQYTAIATGSTVNPAYDTDGNLTDDGTKLYEWDAENRLVAVKRKSDSASIATYTYDDQSRRVRKVTTSIATQGASDKVFLWDGWNLVGELNNSSGTFTAVRYYAWGLDLSGSTQGAGGVGGLILEKDASSGEGYFPTFDSNGNVVNLVQASSGSTVATYEYDPFGRVLTSSGGYAANNPIRYSTKFQDAETNWNYYGYRYYSADLGRWPSRDPIGENGGENLYGFVGNDCVTRIDTYGLLSESQWEAVRKLAAWRYKNADLAFLIEQVDSLIGDYSWQQLYEAVKREANITHPLQDKMLKNWMQIDGFTEDPLKLTVEDAISAEIQFRMFSNSKFQADVKNKATPKGSVFSGSYENISATAGLGRTLGNFEVDVKAEVKACNVDGTLKWEANGTFIIKDIYDFNYTNSEAERAVKDFVNPNLSIADLRARGYDNRSFAGELEVVLMSRIKGKDYQVTSDPVPFKEGDSYSVRIGGK
jgi:RHS repeat-associated protein